MRKFSLALLAGTAAVGIASPSLAQDGADSEEVAENGGENDNTIVVTATRREVNLQDVPAAVVSITPEDFTLNGQTSIKDLIRYQPGLLFDEADGAASRGTITARGIPQLGATPTFATYIDDMPLTSNTPYNQGAFIAIDGLLLDIERVEIVKGPQGTLFGATSVGGMLRYVTKKPALYDVRGTATADLHTVRGGEIGQTYNGRVSVPVVEGKLGVSVGAFYQEIAGYLTRHDPATGAIIEDDVGGSDIHGFAGDILFQATDNLELRVKYMRQETKSDDLFSVQLAGGPDSTDGLFADYSTISTGDDLDLTSEYISGSIDWDLDFATLTSTTSWSNVRQDVNADVTAAFSGFIDLITGQAPGTTQSVSLLAPLTTKKFIQEVRLVSAPSDSFEWLVGGYYANERGTNVQDTVITPEPPFTIFFADFPSQYKEFAGYGNATVYLSENLDVTAGLRVTRNEVDFDFFSEGFLVTFGAPAIDIEQSITDTVVTYLGNIRWRPTDDLSIYARVASGYRGPAPNFVLVDALGQPLTFPTVESDSAWSYEIGAKGSAIDGVLDFDISAFYIDFSKFQAGFTINNLGVLGNSDDGLKSKGFDASFTLYPAEGFTLVANAGYASSQLNSDEPGFGGIGDVQVPGVPKWKASLLWDYTHQLSDDWTANFGGGIRYIDSFQSTYTFLEAIGAEVDDRTIADINLSVSNDNLRFGLYVTNLFDSRKLTNRSDAILAVDPVSGAPLAFNSTGTFERPRTIGGNVTFSF